MLRVKAKSLFGFCLSAFLLMGCAQVVTPSGGPKDTKPPKALEYTPENKGIHFSAKKIIIRFNKYIQIKDLTNQLVVSPPLKHFPKVLARGKELEIDLKDTLLDNTTYSFNFGNSIADITEGNIAANFRYVVSTGSYIDSLKLSGQVKDAYTQEPQKDALVMLYVNQNDSAPFKELPSYCGRTDASGNFLIENLKSATYKLIVLSKSQNGYLYHPNGEGIAFSSKPIELTRNDTVNAYLFTEDEPKLHMIKARGIERGRVIIVFNKPVDSLSVVPISLPKDAKPYTLIQYSATHDTAYYWINSPNLDSLRFILQRKNKNMDTAMIYSFPGKVTPKKDAKPIPLRISSNVHDRQADFDFHYPIVLKAEHPIMKYDLSRIYLTHLKDTLKVKVDSTDLPFILKLKCDLTSDSSYRLFVAPGALTDIFGHSNDTLLAQFKIQEPTFFGSLKVNLQFADKGTYIIQLTDAQGNTLKQDIVNKAKSVNYDALPPGTYRLRAIKDDNGDGKWTTGNYLMKLQPEKVFYFPQSFTVRSNWDDTSEYWLVK
jgi:hypothetical protein